MRKFLILFLFIAILAGPLFSVEEAKPPFLTMNLILKDSFAFTGLGLEILLGNLGLGGTFTTFFMGVPGTDVTVFLYEPGVYVHFYFADPSAALYALLDISFLGAGAMSSQGSATTENTGILNLNAGIGFNAYFGSKKDIHFSIELGARYPYFVLAGSVVEGLQFPVFPHFQLQFGMGLI